MDNPKVGLNSGSLNNATPRPRKRTIARASLSEELAKRLRDMIIDGELRPGARVSTLGLCNRFGVSRTPFREALKILATEGLIQLKPNQGAVVERVTAALIDELTPILGMLEALAGQMACARIDADTLAKIEALHERLLYHSERREQRSYMEIESAILQMVFAVAANETLTRFYQTLITKLQWQTACQHAVPEWEASMEVQKHLLRALQVRDHDLWGLVAQRHVLQRATLLLRAASPIAKGKAPCMRGDGG